MIRASLSHVFLRPLSHHDGQTINKAECANNSHAKKRTPALASTHLVCQQDDRALKAPNDVDLGRRESSLIESTRHTFISRIINDTLYETE